MSDTDNTGLLRENADLRAYLRTLSAFGGTLQQARDLAAKALLKSGEREGSSTDTLDHLMPTDDEIEYLAKKYLVPGADLLRKLNTSVPPYQQTEQFHDIKAMIQEVLRTAVK